MMNKLIFLVTMIIASSALAREYNHYEISEELLVPRAPVVHTYPGRRVTTYWDQWGNAREVHETFPTDPHSGEDYGDYDWEDGSGAE